MTKKNPSAPPANGEYAAAVFAAAIGLLVLALVQIGTEASATFKETVFDVGKAWIPGAAGIGPYSGKETFMLVAWLGSWAILHAAIGKKDLDTRKWFGQALAILFLATILMWPPIWHILLGE